MMRLSVMRLIGGVLLGWVIGYVAWAHHPRLVMWYLVWLLVDVSYRVSLLERLLKLAEEDHEAEDRTRR